MIRMIDIVCAVRNEGLSLKPFVDNVRRIHAPECKIRMAFVEDGSSDSTLAVLKELAHTSEDIAYFSLINPYGQGLALTYGIINSNADAVITIDADGSHPIEIAERMIQLYLDGYDIVQGNRITYNRKSFYRKIASKVYFCLFSIFTGVNLNRQNVHFRLMSSKAVDMFRNSPKTWFSARLKNMNCSQFRLYSIDFAAPERVEGKSKFNFKRLLSFAYIAFLTLTDIPMFIMLSSVFGIFAALSFSRIPGLSVLIILALILNGFAYYHANSVDYIGGMKLTESFKPNPTR